MSIVRRARCGPNETSLWDRWKRVIQPTMLKIAPFYYELTKHKDVLPSGQQKCDLTFGIKKKMWAEEKRAKLEDQARRQAKAGKTVVDTELP
eukprot:1544696-Pleurochrysis_carterae.AAC.1